MLDKYVTIIDKESFCILCRENAIQMGDDTCHDYFLYFPFHATERGVINVWGDSLSWIGMSKDYFTRNSYALSDEETEVAMENHEVKTMLKDASQAIEKKIYLISRPNKMRHSFEWLEAIKDLGEI